MLQQVPPPVTRYLEELELAVKQEPGIAPEEALTDAREFLCSDIEALLRSDPETNDDAIYAHILQSYGTPESVAASYAQQAGVIPDGNGHAPGWRICCTRCGRSAPAAKAGIVRIKARSKHKYTVGWCRDCRWLSWLRIEQDLHRANLTQELGLKYTAEELRHKRHRPWLTVAIVLGCLTAVWSVQRWMWQPSLPEPPSAANAQAD